MIHVDGIRVDLEGNSQELANEICLLIISLCEAAEVTVTDFIKDFGGWLDYHGIDANEIPRGFGVDVEDEEEEDEMLTNKEVKDFMRFLAEHYKGVKDDAEDERSTEEVQDLRQKGHEELDHRKAYRRRSRE